MKTKILLLMIIFAAILISGCKRQKEIPALKKLPVEISKEDYAILSSKNLDRLEKSQLFMKAGDYYSIKNSNSKGALVYLFKEDFTFDELKPILKEIPLTVKSGYLLVENYESFLFFYESCDSFHVLAPKPKYCVQFDGEDYTYYLKENFGFWKHR